MNRVETLATQVIETDSEIDNFGVRWIKDKLGKHTKYIMLVPLLEILAESLESGSGSQKTVSVYELLLEKFGNEFNVLLRTSIKDIKNIAGERVSEAVSKVRSADIVIDPGYDGVFGKVAIWREGEQARKEKQIDQKTLF